MTTDELLTYARDTVGVAMGSLYKGVHIGWTTDAAKADALEKAGARVATVTAFTWKETTGFEISFGPDVTVQAREGTGRGRRALRLVSDRT